MLAKHNERTNKERAPMTNIKERQILTAYREQALNRLRNANVALWRTLACQNGDNTIEVNLKHGLRRGPKHLEGI
jgi:hypothetical protein